MLKAYDYIDATADRNTIQKSENFNKELKLAKKAVSRVLQMEQGNSPVCPGCAGRKLSVFFTKWGVDYLRCPDCGTIFCEVDDETLAEYHSDQDLNEFRSRDEYQQEASEKRRFSWQEIIDWIQFRSFRYLKKNKGLSIVSGGDRFTGFTEMVKNSDICGSYSLLGVSDSPAEVALSFNLLQQSNAPVEHLTALNRQLENGGLLFLSARIGSGFDILVLKEHAQVYPYEYVTLLSRESLTAVLEKAGFEVLDYSTPGAMDVGYVQSKREAIPQDDLFIRNLIFDSDSTTLREFQRFLQKSGMSSYAQIVARKREER